MKDKVQSGSRMDQFPSLLLAGNFLSGEGGSRGPIEDLAERLKDGGAQLTCASSIRNGFMRGADLVSTAILNRNRYQAGIVDLYSGKAFLWGEALSILLKLLGRPFVLVLHGGGLPEFATRFPERVKACLERATSVTAPSRYLIDSMKAYREDIQLIPNPLDIDCYPFTTRFQAKPSLIWLRSFHHIYNPELVPRTIALLVKDFPDIRIIMVGPDKGDGSLAKTKAKSDELGVTKHIEYAGGVPRSEVPVWLNRGDIFVNTTDIDNTPVSVLEAMGCGLCVVTTNAGGIPKLLTNETNALLVPRNDPEAMAAAIRRVLDSPALAEKLSIAGRHLAESFDWSAVLPRWRALLCNLTKTQ